MGSNLVEIENVSLLRIFLALHGMHLLLVDYCDDVRRL